jgi:hypothetical protein
VIAALNAEGAVLPRWSARAGLGHGTHWIEDGGPSSTESFSLGTTLDVSRTFELSFDTQVGAKAGRLTSGAPRYSTTSSGHARMVPLRSVSITLSGDLQANGTELLQPSSRARSGGINVTWRPIRPASFTIVRSVAGAFPYDWPRQVTTGVSGSLQLGKSSRLDANYSKLYSTDATSSLFSEGSETRGVRFASRMSRRWNGSLGFQQSGRGQPFESRALDAMLSYRFAP